MRNHLPDYFLLVILSLALAFNSSGKVHTFPKERKGHAQAFDIPSLPHNDLDEVRRPLVNAAQAGVQKSLNVASFLQHKTLYSTHASFNDFIIRFSTLLISAYLSHNYPTHTFW